MRFALPIIGLLILLTFFSSCSPGYVLRAGWEETGILWRRKPIDKIIAASDTDAELRRKLELVVAAREFAEHHGLLPSGSYTSYSKIDRDVLVWVLSAASKTSLNPYVWWFPIVGDVPYKGFFDKEDGIAAQNKLGKEGYDTYLRPSPAFSTLGWFDDPLLSTIIRYDDTALADTVIHEILHNTVWIRNNVAFNETLANFVGARGAYELFLQLDGPNSTRATETIGRWHDEVQFARFLEQTVEELTKIYKNPDLANQDEEILKQREAALVEARNRWQAELPRLQTKHFANAASNLNNAVILAHQVYLTKPWLFEEYFQKTGGSLKAFVEGIKALQEETSSSKQDPFIVLEEKIKGAAEGQPTSK